MKLTSLLFLSILTITTTLAQVPGSIDLSFDPGTGFDGYVTSLLIQPDGKIIAIGEYTEYNGVPNNGIVRLNPDGQPDPTFNAGTGFNTTWLGTMVLQPDGKIVVGGQYSTYNGVAVPGIVRLNTDGSLDNTFDASSVFTGDVTKLALQTTGKLIAYGYFPNGLPGQPQGGYYTVRLNENGTLDQSFDYLDNIIRGLADGPIYHDSAYYDATLGENRRRIIKLNADGEVDPSDDYFYPELDQPGYGGYISEAVSIGNGKILVTGDFHELIDTTGTITPNIGILDELTGGNDTSFDSGTGFNEGVEAMAYDNSNEKIYTGGRYNFYNGSPVSYLLRLNMDGSIDNTFQTGAGFDGIPNLVYLTDIKLQSDGKLLVCGSFDSYDGVARSNIVRLSGTTTSIKAMEESTMFTAFPNPSNGELIVETTQEGDYAVMLVNPLGQILYNEFHQNSQRIPVSVSSSGVYQLMVQTEESFDSKTIVIR